MKRHMCQQTILWSIPSPRKKIMSTRLSGHKRTASGSLRGEAARVIVLDTHRLRAALAELQRVAEGEKVGKYAVCKLQLRMARELVVAASSLLDFLARVVELEELAAAAQDDIVPRLGRMIDECDFLLVDTGDPIAWQPNPARDAQTLDLLTHAIAAMSAVLAVIFHPQSTHLRAPERRGIMLACRTLFEAADDLLRAATEEGEGVGWDDVMGGFMAGAVARCEDRVLAEYEDE